jgi:hypothetical protein
MGLIPKFVEFLRDQTHPELQVWLLHQHHQPEQQQQQQLGW